MRNREAQSSSFDRLQQVALLSQMFLGFWAHRFQGVVAGSTLGNAAFQ